MAGPDEKRQGAEAGGMRSRRRSGLLAMVITEADDDGGGADAGSRRWRAQVGLEVEMVVLRRVVGIIFHLGEVGSLLGRGSLWLQTRLEADFVIGGRRTHARAWEPPLPTNPASKSLPAFQQAN